MADNILDRIDREHGGDSRRYIAQLFAAGASRAEVAEALRRKYGQKVTTRSITTWRNNDAKLIALIEELAAIKRDLDPDDDTDPAALLRDPAQDTSDLFGVAIQFPSFAKLLRREDERRTGAAGLPFAAPAADLDVEGDDVRKVLTDGHESDADFAAACKALLGDYAPHPA